MLKLYNSLTRSLEDFSPLNDVARVYSCGPTVYDNVHIGNLSSFIFTDSLHRALKAAGYRVKHVMNITDVDDKTIKRSKTDFPEQSPEVALKSTTTLYETRFKDDLRLVGNDIGELDFIKATDSIQLMQDLIINLIEGGFGYIADDGIYFSIQAYQNNGKKYGQLIELDTANTSKARINNDEYDKNSTHDFVLWKFMRPGEPTWSFVVKGQDYLGRPGWHIECSAMSSGALSQPYDIHTGGVDLIFPHHENEIAQSTAGKDNPVYAVAFVHNEHLLVDKRKMSKSLGNVYNLSDVIEHAFDPLSYRLLILQSHYRSQANFSWELLEAANSRLSDLRNFASLVYQAKDKTSKEHDFNGLTQLIKAAFLDDLNTPKALAILSDFQNLLQEDLIDHSQEAAFKQFIKFLDELFGLNLSSVDDIGPAQKELLNQRQSAREQEQWTKSDEIRNDLKSSGLGVRDTPYGQIWFRI